MEQFIHAAGHRVNTLQIGEVRADKPALVFIHGGLDCIAMWRDFPSQVTEMTGLAAIVYERWGHGKSDPLVVPREGDPREDEAGAPLTDIFRHFGLKDVVLIGHSFGGAVALLAAAKHPDTVRGVVAMAPQLVMHPQCIDGVDLAEAAYKSGKLREKLVPFHGDNTDTLFFDWAGRSKTRAFQEKSYARELEQIRCPVLEIFGEKDNYGYRPNLELSRECITRPLSVLEIPEAGHYPHLETPEHVLKAIEAFVGVLPAAST
ncbi:MAG TPA: alpha/beta hydrolase [Gammaproteobacteria bacterium]|nr:alpha/beta hydrolase [Gammaproteobacteria bacterium]